VFELPPNCIQKQLHCSSFSPTMYGGGEGVVGGSCFLPSSLAFVIVCLSEDSCHCRGAGFLILIPDG
jgi:hypothetical protein